MRQSRIKKNNIKTVSNITYYLSKFNLGFTKTLKKPELKKKLNMKGCHFTAKLKLSILYLTSNFRQIVEQFAVLNKSK